MASKKITAMPDLAGAQVPTDLTTLVDLSAAAANQNVKSTLNDLFAEITKNITDLSVQFGDGAAATVSAINKGKIRYNDTASSFQVSEDNGAYQNLLKGSGTATRVAFWSAADELSSDGAFYWQNTDKRLGIGVGATPEGPLDVLADGAALAQQWRGNTGTLRVQMILDTVPEASLGTSSNHTFHLLSNNLQRLTIENDGLIGINKGSAIQAQLQVVSQDATTEALILNSAASPSANIAEFYNDSSIRFAFSPAANLGIGLSGAGGATGSITLNGVTSGAVNLTVAAAAGTWTLTLPTTDGNAGEFLQTDGNGVTTWAAAGSGTPGNPVNSVQFNNAGAFGGDSAFLWDSTNDRLLLGVAVASGQAPLDVLADGTALAQQWRGNTGTLRVQMVLDTVPEASLGTSSNHTFHLLSNNLQRLTVENDGLVGINKASAIQAQLQVVSQDATTEALILNSAASPSANIAEFYNDSSIRFAFSPAANLGIGLSGAGGATGSITLNGVTSGAVNLTVAAAAGTWTLTLPTTDGNAGEFLQTDGNGVTTWAAAGGATINATDTVIPYRSSATAFSDSQLIRLSSAITELRNVAVGTTAQTFNIYGTAANNTASAPTEYVRANHNATSTAINMIAEIATPSTTAVAGINVNITASAAVAGASVAGAAAGGAVTIRAGNAARLTSGNADGGTIFLVPGTAIGSGIAGVIAGGTASTSPAFSPFDSVFFGQGGFFVTDVAKTFNRYIGVAALVVCDSPTASSLNSGNPVRISGSGLEMISSFSISWSSSSSLATNTKDLQIIRAAANVARITNGSTGAGAILLAPSTASVTGNFTVLPDNAATNSVVTVARLGVNSTGTAADGFGAALSWSAETSTTNDTETARNNVFWTTATHASRTSAISWSLVNNATLAEVMRLSAPGVSSSFCLSLHSGTAPNVWTSGTLAAKLYLIDTNLAATGVAAHFGSSAADSARWQLLRGRGTNAAPAAIQNGDVLGGVQWAGYFSTTTNSYVSGADILAAATETWSAGVNGSRMVFRNAPNGGTQTERLSLEQTGTFRIGAFLGSFSANTLLQVGNYASWNTDTTTAIYSGANGTKGLEIIGTNAQTADLFRVFLDAGADLFSVQASGAFLGRVFTVAGLPSAATAGAGARAFVSDALAPTILTTVAGGGAVKVPVYSDGTNWLVG